MTTDVRSLEKNPLYIRNFSNFGLWPKVDDPERLESAKNLYRLVAEIIKISGEDYVLEIGCGAGGGGALILQEKEPREIVCIDSSKERIRYAESRHTCLNPDRITFRVGYGEFIPLNENTFDKIFSIEAAHFFKFKEFTEEVERVLKPKGEICIASFFSTNSHTNPNLIEAIKKISDRRIEDPPPSVSTLTHWLRKVGFQSIKVQAIGERVWPGFHCYWTSKKTSAAWTEIWLSAYKKKEIDYYVISAYKPNRENSRQGFSSTPSELTIHDTNYSHETASSYSKFGIQGTSLLAFRDVKHLIKKYVTGKKALDYGCGAGRSTRFLNSLGFEVEGVDISTEFLKKAREQKDKIHYMYMSNSTIPQIEEQYDFVFSSFVLLMIPSKEELKQYFDEAYRVLKEGGIFIPVTNSEEMHSVDRDWVSYNTDFPENKYLGSGTVAKLVIKETETVFYDYNWLDEDYRSLLKSSGFMLLEKSSPLAKKGEEGIQWLSETKYSPFNIYVAKKISS